MAKNIETASADDLRAELARRGIAEKQAEADAAPKPLAKPDFSGVIETATNSVAAMIRDRYENDDIRVYVYEEVMTAIYGDDFFKWKNKFLHGIDR